MKKKFLFLLIFFVLLLNGCSNNHKDIPAVRSQGCDSEGTAGNTMSLQKNITEKMLFGRWSSYNYQKSQQYFTLFRSDHVVERHFLPKSELSPETATGSREVERGTWELMPDGTVAAEFFDYTYYDGSSSAPYQCTYTFTEDGLLQRNSRHPDPYIRYLPDGTEKETAYQYNDSEIMRYMGEELFKPEGTWTNVLRPSFDSSTEEWIRLYSTRFSQNGEVIHFGNRNFDKGTWKWIDDHTIEATFSDCTYAAPDSTSHYQPISGYQCTYSYERGMLYRDTDRSSYAFPNETMNEAPLIIVTDMDDYSLPLKKKDNEANMNLSFNYYPDEPEYNEKLEKAVIAAAKDLYAGNEVRIETVSLPFEIESAVTYDITGDGLNELFLLVSAKINDTGNEGIFYVISGGAGSYRIIAKNSDIYSGYTEILAPDGTALIPFQNYPSSSSWKGGHRIHLGFEKGRITVDREESYSFHWGPTILLEEDDYKNGFYRLFAADSEVEGECYTSYAAISERYLVDEEQFEPMYFPLTGFSFREISRFPIVRLWNPFNDNWWLEGGCYPEEEYYNHSAEWAAAHAANWISEAADDNPDEILSQAVAASGLVMKKTPYPWTAETKANVTKLLRCPVAGYYYISDYYAAAYIRGEVIFYQKKISADGYRDTWEEMEL